MTALADQDPVEALAPTPRREPGVSEAPIAVRCTGCSFVAIWDRRDDGPDEHRHDCGRGRLEYQALDDSFDGDDTVMIGGGSQ